MENQPKTEFTADEKQELEQDQLLLSIAAAMNAQNGSGQSPFSGFASFKKIEPLTYACTIGKMFMVKQAINEGANVNETDEDGITPLHVAAENGYVEIVELLLNYGADQNRRDK